jgi:hypothetical protein
MTVRMAGITRPIASRNSAGPMKATSWTFSLPRFGARSTRRMMIPTTSANAASPYPS